jgi:hypothetical protein
MLRNVQLGSEIETYPHAPVSFWVFLKLASGIACAAKPHPQQLTPGYAPSSAVTKERIHPLTKDFAVTGIGCVLEQVDAIINSR